jgi:hypothetical protein
MRRGLGFCAAAGFAAAVFFFTSPAQASYRVIKWNVTNICQIYNFGWEAPQFPPTTA